MSLPACGGRLAFWRAVGCVLYESDLPRGRVLLEVTSEGSGKRATGVLAAAGCARAAGPGARALGGGRRGVAAWPLHPGVQTAGSGARSAAGGSGRSEERGRVVRPQAAGFRRPPPSGTQSGARRPGGAVALAGRGEGGPTLPGPALPGGPAVTAADSPTSCFPRGDHSAKRTILSQRFKFRG